MSEQPEQHAPSLPQLRDMLRRSLAAYPELRRGLRAALAQLDQVDPAGEPARRRRDRRYGRRDSRVVE